MFFFIVEFDVYGDVFVVFNYFFFYNMILMMLIDLNRESFVNILDDQDGQVGDVCQVVGDFLNVVNCVLDFGKYVQGYC